LELLFWVNWKLGWIAISQAISFKEFEQVAFLVDEDAVASFVNLHAKIVASLA